MVLVSMKDFTIQTHSAPRFFTFFLPFLLFLPRILAHFSFHSIPGLLLFITTFHLILPRIPFIFLEFPIFFSIFVFFPALLTTSRSLSARIYLVTSLFTSDEEEVEETFSPVTSYFTTFFSTTDYACRTKAHSFHFFSWRSAAANERANGKYCHLNGWIRWLRQSNVIDYFQSHHSGSDAESFHSFSFHMSHVYRRCRLVCHFGCITFNRYYMETHTHTHFHDDDCFGSGVKICYSHLACALKAHWILHRISRVSFTIRLVSLFACSC